MTLSRTAHADSLVTFIFAHLSLLGSILVLISYMVARSKNTPRIANLILHLAASDFFWFLSAGIQSAYWLFSPSNSVPTNACFILSPLMIFTRMASLAWTCVISFNVLMSVEKRKWLWQGGNKAYIQYHNRYYFAIFLLAAPGTILTLVKQHSSDDTSDLGCSPNYEALGVWYEVFFPEVLPILMGFLCNVYVFLNVYGKISKSAYPQSVRKRRKRIMYHYIIVCIICWVPTVLNYMIELIGYHSTVVEILARACLYSSGFLNFLVFGMQDPHLKRSFKIILHYTGLACLCSLFLPSSSLSYYSPLRAADVEKNVMFQEDTITSNADLSKDKRSVYRNRKLSKADRLHLYTQRPDLDLRSPIPSSSPSGGSDAAVVSDVPNKSAMKKGKSVPTPIDETTGGGASSALRNAAPSREEAAALLFHNHIAAGTLVMNSAVAPSISNQASAPMSMPNCSERTRSNSRSRSSSFHSGVSDGKYDLLAPLLGAEEKARSNPQAASSFPSSSYFSARNAPSTDFFGLTSFLSPNMHSSLAKESPAKAVRTNCLPRPMDVVGAGCRSSSTEKLVGNIDGDNLDIEEGNRLMALNSAQEKERDVRRQLEKDLDGADDLSSSDDESDDEDKELSIPISAL